MTSILRVMETVLSSQFRSNDLEFEKIFVDFFLQFWNLD